MEKAKTFQELPKDYWDVVGKYLPNYYRSNAVLHSDILTRYVEGEEVNEEDLEWLPSDKDEARKQLEELDLRLYNEAVEEWERRKAMIQSIDWKAYKQDLMFSIKNEEIWLMGSLSDSEADMHIDNIHALEEELDAVERGDYEALICMHSKEDFKDFLLKEAKLAK